jgi:hypothetical protein
MDFRDKKRTKKSFFDAIAVVTSDFRTQKPHRTGRNAVPTLCSIKRMIEFCRQPTNCGLANDEKKQMTYIIEVSVNQSDVNVLEALEA